MQAINLVLATLTDHPLLTRLMQEYYALDGLVYNASVNEALHHLLQHPEHGEIYLLTEHQEPLGYCVLTWWYSLEFQGKAAFLDEIYLRPQARNRGLGSQIIQELSERCQTRGIKTLRLEVEHENEIAQKAYLKNGFEHHERYLMTKWV